MLDHFLREFNSLTFMPVLGLYWLIPIIAQALAGAAVSEATKPPTMKTPGSPEPLKEMDLSQLVSKAQQPNDLEKLKLQLQNRLPPPQQPN